MSNPKDETTDEEIAYKAQVILRRLIFDDRDSRGPETQLAAIGVERTIIDGKMTKKAVFTTRGKRYERDVREGASWLDAVLEITDEANREYEEEVMQSSGMK